jgi:hypothetical protein
MEYELEHGVFMSTYKLDRCLIKTKYVICSEEFE